MAGHGRRPRPDGRRHAQGSAPEDLPMPRFRPAALLLIAVLFASSATAAPDTSALINEALDQPVKLELNTVLPKAMATIGDKTGVRIEADPAVWDLLPWGEQTNLKAKIENQTLRAALNA